jgi:hypothetical protein
VASTDHGGGKRRLGSGMGYIYTNKQCITTTPAKSEWHPASDRHNLRSELSAVMH